jgi:hypothetical protein
VADILNGKTPLLIIGIENRGFRLCDNNGLSLSHTLPLSLSGAERRGQ